MSAAGQEREYANLVLAEANARGKCCQRCPDKRGALVHVLGDRSDGRHIDARMRFCAECIDDLRQNPTYGNYRIVGGVIEGGQA